VLPADQVGTAPRVGGQAADLGDDAQPAVAGRTGLGGRGLVEGELLGRREGARALVAGAQVEHLQGAAGHQPVDVGQRPGLGGQVGRVRLADVQQPLAAGEPLLEVPAGDVDEVRVVLVHPAHVVGLRRPVGVGQ
jgi:hypothetical protein